MIEGKGEYKERIEKEKIKEPLNRKLHVQYERDTKEIKSDKTWEFLNNGDLKRETEGLIFAAQEQALNTNAIRSHICCAEASTKHQRN